MTTDEGATRIRFPLLTARARIRPDFWLRSDNRPDDGLRPG